MKFLSVVVATIGLYITLIAADLTTPTPIDIATNTSLNIEIDFETKNLTMNATLYNATIFEVMGTQENSNGQLTLKNVIGLMLAEVATMIAWALIIPFVLYEAHLQHKGEEAFTRAVVKGAYAKYPCYNHIVWHVHEAHDNKTALAQFSDTRDLTCIQHAFELRIFGLGLPRKQLYMMCTLAEGTFTHKGDGGYINWAYEGNVTRSDEHGKPYVHGPIANFLPIKLNTCNASIHSLEQGTAEKPSIGNHITPWDVPLRMAQLEEEDPVGFNKMHVVH